MDKLLEDSKSNRDKIQKLAVQFDKELADRDKQHTALRSQVMSDLQKLGGSVAADIEHCRKQVGELEVKKADKREIIEVKGFIVNGLDAKVNVSDLQQTLNKHSGDSQQKAFELRQELFKKVSEIQSLVSAGVGTKVTIEEFNEAMSTKIDLTTFRTMME